MLCDQFIRGFLPLSKRPEHGNIHFGDASVFWALTPKRIQMLVHLLKREVGCGEVAALKELLAVYLDECCVVAFDLYLLAEHVDGQAHSLLFLPLSLSRRRHCNAAAYDHVISQPRRLRR